MVVKGLSAQLMHSGEQSNPEGYRRTSIYSKGSKKTPNRMPDNIDDFRELAKTDLRRDSPAFRSMELNNV
ncbi:hypothetical protein GN958_ATG14146 [Phytophthora infestans]|uniref:Uncharacterized protein n=1 Tax=Phytophthora infestans TaxID=4787 RepID=A0A8S9TS50_PHYIN|nr:hypothetical protein GN958_ATG21046 [Phytophthora infestans]KAF4136656.1 hypothetical protein GN958_ATG14146 [Phytophthora infestans]